mmetsp:Transcript_28660/g.84467  ORF Transcript_28660/g.84467 Transcript_28660/m.84467 type:complete len:220 (+) Transcript_28660:400-1059(+)
MKSGPRGFWKNSSTVVDLFPRLPSPHGPKPPLPKNRSRSVASSSHNGFFALPLRRAPLLPFLLLLSRPIGLPSLAPPRILDDDPSTCSFLLSRSRSSLSLLFLGSTRLLLCLRCLFMTQSSGSVPISSSSSFSSFPSHVLYSSASSCIPSILSRRSLTRSRQCRRLLGGACLLFPPDGAAAAPAALLAPLPFLLPEGVVRLSAASPRSSSPLRPSLLLP